MFYFILLSIFIFVALLDFSNRSSKATFVFILGALLVLVAGTRSGVGFDYESYQDNFKYFSDFDSVFKGNKEIGFSLLNYFFNRLSSDFGLFLLLCAFISIFSKLIFIYKYGEFPFIALIVYVGGYFLFGEMGQFRQMFALSFCLLATHYLIVDRRKSFYFWVLIATLFHATSIAYLLVPRFVDSKISTRIKVIIPVFAGCLALAFLPLQNVIYSLINVLKFFGFGYADYLLYMLQNQGALDQPGTLSFGFVIKMMFFFCALFLCYKSSNYEHRIVANIYVVGYLIMLSLYSIQIVAGRMSESFVFMEVLVLGYIISFMKPRLLGYLIVLFVVVLYSFLKMSLMISHSSGAYMYYNSWLF